MIGFFKDASRDARQPLAKGLQLGSYRLERMLASGGFSLVYLAKDARGEAVAIKEYLPAVLATRKGRSPVPTVAASTAAAYRHGLQCFFEEAKALSSLSHPNVVRVLDFFREHDTAYMVMSHEIASSRRRSRRPSCGYGRPSSSCSTACARCTRAGSCTWTSSRATSTCAATARPS